jgi:hypothetical protein
MSREIEHDPRTVEYAVGGAPRLNAFRSLATSRGVHLRTVLEAVERDELRSVVELRAHKTLSPCRPGWGTKDPEQVLEILAFKRAV